MGDGSPIRCRRKGQRLVVDSDGEQEEQSLEVLCQKMNDDRRGNLCSPPSDLIQTRPGDGRGRSFPGTLPDVRPTLRLGEEIAVKVAFDRTTLDSRTLPDPFGLLTATLKNPLRSVGCFLSDSAGFYPFGVTHGGS